MYVYYNVTLLHVETDHMQFMMHKEEGKIIIRIQRRFL